MRSTWKTGIATGLFILVRMILGAVFIYASWDKIVNPADFAKVVANYQILPQIMINPVAWILPWLEMVCGVCLLIGWIARGSALIIAGLLMVFIGALGYSLLRGLDIQCGCFSLTAERSVPLYIDILRDAFLLVMAILTVGRPRRKNAMAMNGNE
jgi:uncharacterized membrane protein YphA (DoxX/SURF4 family)